MSQFIKFYNKFSDHKDIYHLSPEEWMIYSLLASGWNPFLDVSRVTVSMITGMQSMFNSKSRPSNDKRKVYEAMRSLRSKGVIDFSEGDIVGYDETILVSFTDVEGGFEPITLELYTRTDNAFYNYFLCTCKCHESNGGLSASHDVIAKITSSSPRKVR